MLERGKYSIVVLSFILILKDELKILRIVSTIRLPIIHSKLRPETVRVTYVPVNLLPFRAFVTARTGKTRGGNEPEKLTINS